LENKRRRKEMTVCISGRLVDTRPLLNMLLADKGYAVRRAPTPGIKGVIYGVAHWTNKDPMNHWKI
jgi:hypothetical protein